MHQTHNMAQMFFCFRVKLKSRTYHDKCQILHRIQVKLGRTWYHTRYQQQLDLTLYHHYHHVLHHFHQIEILNENKAIHIIFHLISTMLLSSSINHYLVLINCLFFWGFTLYQWYFTYLTVTLHKSMFPEPCFLPVLDQSIILTLMG